MAGNGVRARCRSSPTRSREAARTAPRWQPAWPRRPWRRPGIGPAGRRWRSRRGCTCRRSRHFPPSRRRTSSTRCTPPGGRRRDRAVAHRGGRPDDLRAGPSGGFSTARTPLAARNRGRPVDVADLVGTAEQGITHAQAISSSRKPAAASSSRERNLSRVLGRRLATASDAVPDDTEELSPDRGRTPTRGRAGSRPGTRCGSRSRSRRGPC